MPAPFANRFDVEAGWRPLDDTEQIVAGTQLAFAAAIIRVNVPDIDARLAAGKLDRDLVKGINAEMVRRYMRNPTGVESTSETIEDYQYTENFDDAVAAGSVYLTDEELALLRTPPRGRRGAFSIVPSGERPTAATWAAIARHRAQRRGDRR